MAADQNLTQVITGWSRGEMIALIEAVEGGGGGLVPGSFTTLDASGATTFASTLAVTGATGIGATFSTSRMLSVGGSQTAVAAVANSALFTTTLVAGANSDALTSVLVSPAFTPGSFTGLVGRGIRVSAFSVAAFTTPADPYGIDIGVVTGTGATNAASLFVGAGPTGATNNYLILGTNFSVTSAGAVTHAALLSSLTAIATPSALAATGRYAFASTVSGGVLMGFGTTNDVTLMNRAGTVVLGVTANTTGVTMAGALAITGALSGVTTLGAVTGTFTGAITSNSPTAKIGYAAGAGGAQTQLTSKATTVVSNTVTTEITTHNATLNAATIVSFTFTNSGLATGDHLMVDHVSGGTVGAYTTYGVAGSGTSTIFIRNNTAGNLGEALVLKATVFKAVTA